MQRPSETSEASWAGDRVVDALGSKPVLEVRSPVSDHPAGDFKEGRTFAFVSREFKPATGYAAARFALDVITGE